MGTKIFMVVEDNEEEQEKARTAIKNAFPALTVVVEKHLMEGGTIEGLRNPDSQVFEIVVICFSKTLHGFAKLLKTVQSFLGSAEMFLLTDLSERKDWSQAVAGALEIHQK